MTFFSTFFRVDGEALTIKAQKVKRRLIDRANLRAAHPEFGILREAWLAAGR